MGRDRVISSRSTMNMTTIPTTVNCRKRVAVSFPCIDFQLALFCTKGVKYDL